MEYEEQEVVASGHEEWGLSGLFGKSAGSLGPTLTLPCHCPLPAPVVNFPSPFAFPLSLDGKELLDEEEGNSIDACFSLGGWQDK